MSAAAVRRVGLALLMALQAGCITPAVREPAPAAPVGSSAAPGPLPAVLETDAQAFDPLRLPESPIRFADTAASRRTPMTLSGGKTVSTAPVMQGSGLAGDPVARTAGESAAARTGTWRVQLYSGRSPATADALVAEARLLFPEHEVDRVGERADLKVLVGHFGSAADAAVLKQRAVRLGFSQAWVVDPGPDTPR